MFFSVGKIFWLIVILWGVWTAFRMIEKRQKRGDMHASTKANSQESSGKSKTRGAASNDVEMQECPTCKSWVNKDGCNHPDCPVKQS